VPAPERRDRVISTSGPALAPVVVVFDLDGTLVDHEGSVRTALARWLPTLGLTLTEDLVAEWFAAERRHFPSWRSGLISFQEQRRRRMRDFLLHIGRESEQPDDRDALFAAYLQQYEAAWSAFDDVEPALSWLSSTPYGCAVLSNGTQAQQEAKIASVGLTDRLGPVFTAEMLGAAKPAPEAFLRTCDALGVQPAQAAYVGDDFDVDIVAARDAGLMSVYLDRNGRGPTGHPYRITSLRRLGDVFAPPPA
jgi:putative hydrolase of the HAD superfamily